MVEIGLQRLLKVRQPSIGRVGIHQVCQVEAACGDLQGGSHKAPELACDVVRVLLAGAQELHDMRGIVVDLPGDVGLHQDAQSVPGADILQPAGRRAQAQVD